MKKKINSTPILALASLLSLQGISHVYAETLIKSDNENILTPGDSAENLTESALAQRAFNYLHHLNFRLELIAQEVSNDKLKAIKNKEQVLQQIARMRTTLKEIINTPSSFYSTDIYKLNTLVYTTKLAVAHVVYALEQEFVELPDFETSGIYELNHDLSTLQYALNETADDLARLDTLADLLGKSLINRLTRQGEELAQKLYLVPIAKRTIFPYGVLFSWWLFTRTQEEVDSMGSRFLSRYKKILGGLPERDIEYISPKTGIYPGTSKPVHGVLGSPTYLLKSMLTIKNDTTLLTVSTGAVGALVWKSIQEDIIKAHAWTSKKAKNLITRLKGEPVFDGPVKKSKFTFKDVIGKDDIKARLTLAAANIIDPESFERKGQLIPQAYLFVGDKHTGKRYMAYAVAGEATNLLKAGNKKEICGYIELAASELLKKNIGDILKEADEKAPCIVIITDLDWLDTQDRKLLSDILSSLSTHLKSKKSSWLLLRQQNLKH